ncbi:F-box/WD repeat-containing protein 4 [Condylostylus longicornis]|uniref:F-box/WD repeat-containing protein 4 n=1 Tax=Condylostylus longicornis TaxID=2530218 RepID=UPI00244DDA1F|nr:F-box/WD repeat-containing protein 4 [Condylostylus longicornis]
MVFITDLSEYVLLEIFKYCNDSDLENLYLTCTLFRNVIEDRVYKIRARNLLLTGYGDGVRNIQNLIRTYQNLSFKDRIMISSNWINGRYKEYTYFHHRKFFASKIFLEFSNFYMSHGEFIRIYKRLKHEPLQRRYAIEISSKVSKSDIAAFVKKGDSLFVIQTCGNCFLYESGEILAEQRLHDVTEYLTCLDYDGKQHFITSSEKTTKLWEKDVELGLVSFELIRNIDNYFKCLKFSDDGAKIYGGLYTDYGRKALREIDVETGLIYSLNSKSLSIYDLKIKDEYTLLSAHFDTTFRLFDRRTNKDEHIWIDPYDSSIYCLEYDGLYGVLCGMKYHSRVNLYDIRMPKTFVQMYFALTKRSCGSPVYSITCDSQYLFISRDNDLRVFDFSASWAPSKDYTICFN